MCNDYTAAQPPVPTEYEVKAAFIFKFSTYISWPEHCLEADPDSFKIGVLGQDPFNNSLENTLKGETYKSRRLIFKRSMNPDDLLDCQIIFISSSEKDRLADHLGKLNKAPILTISDMEHFSEQGGMITFVQQGKKIRFEINVDAASNAELKISSKLLQLAKKIHPNSRQ